MKELFSLGELYVSDFIEESTTARPHDLTLVMLEDGNVRLKNPAPLDTMFGKYWYRSGTNATMTKELKGIVESINSIYKTSPSDVWLDIACNDGTLLKFVDASLNRVGVDPVDSSFVKESSQHGTIIQDYFSAESYKKVMGEKKAKIVTIIAMLVVGFLVGVLTAGASFTGVPSINITG